MSDEPRTPKEVAESKRQIVIAYRAVFGSAQGPVVLEDMAAACGIFNNGYSTDAGELAFRAGKRAVFLGIVKILGTTRGELMALTGVRKVEEHE